MNRSARPIRAWMGFGVALLLGAAPTRGDAIQPLQLGKPCAATLDGTRFPSLVPAVFVWPDLMRTIQVGPPDPAWSELAGATGLTGEEFAVLKPLAATGLATPASPPGPPSSSPPFSADTLVSQEESMAGVADAREAILRAVPEASAIAIDDWSRSTAARRLFPMNIPGEVVATGDGRVGCRVSVNGRDRFWLIPDGYVWEFYFRVRARVAEMAAQSSGIDAYQQILQQAHLPISLEDIRTVLEVATATIREVDVLRERPDDEAARLQIASLLAKARIRLLHRLSPDAWHVVLADVRRSHQGTTYDFPTGM